MSPYQCAPLNLACLALMFGMTLGSHASLHPTSLYSLSRIRSKSHPLGADSAFHHSKLQVRGGAADDDYRQSYDRREYDDRPRRRPPPPPGGERGGRAMRSDGPESRPSRDFEERPQYGRRFDEDGERRMGRDGDRWEREQRERRPYRPEKRKAESVPSEKKKSWFGSKKNQEPEELKPSQQQQPPPPPPPPNTFANYNPAESERVPINYMFPTTEVAASERAGDETITDFDPMGGPDLPVEDADDYFVQSTENSKRRRRRMDDEESYASPRRDAVTMYMSTRLGAAKVRFGSIVVGAALGSFIGKVRFAN